MDVTHVYLVDDKRLDVSVLVLALYLGFGFLGVARAGFLKVSFLLY